MVCIFRKPLVFCLIITLTLVFIAACSSESVDNKDVRPGADYKNELGTPSPGDTPPNDSATHTGRKIIYEASLSVTVTAVNSAVTELQTKALALGGYVAQSRRNSNDDQPTATITYRIPQQKFEDFLAFARSLGEAADEFIDSEDITEEFVDLEARLKNTRAHEERLQTMYELGSNIDELLSLERELARVRGDIETMEGRLRYLQEMTDLALVTVRLSQEPGTTAVPGIRPVGFKETLRRALKAIVTSCNFFLDVLSYGFIAIAALLPFALPALAVFFLILYLIKKKKKQQA